MPRLRPLVLLLLTVPAGCCITDVELWTPPPGAPEDCAVRRVRDLAYVDGPDADPRQRLDLHLPEGRSDFPVVVLVHGGAWVTGDNRACGLYSSVGGYLASRGIGVVMPNYRLSPAVKHPEHVKDIARAFAWTRRHIAEYGGDPERLLLVGHSAGGHLVSLLCTDERYLKAEGLATSDIKGVVAVSGVYNLRPGSIPVRIGGPTARALRPDKFLPLRSGTRPIFTQLPGLPLRLDIFTPPFGVDPEARADASPLMHVRSGLPPFLLIVGDNDLPTLADLAVEFHAALLDKGCEAERMTVASRNHHSIIFCAVSKDDPVGKAVPEFIARCLSER